MAAIPSQCALDKGIFEVFERRQRLIAPSVAAFKECGRVLAALFRKDGVSFKERPRSLVNDILIAPTCRENGFSTFAAAAFTLVSV